MKKSKILILSTLPRFSLSLVRSAAIAGFKPIVVTDKPWGLEHLSRYIGGRYLIDQSGLELGDAKTFQQLNQIIRNNQIDIVVPADTRSTRVVAQHGDLIQEAALFPIPSFNLFNQLYDKWSFGQFLEAHNIPHPKTRLIEFPEQVAELDLEFPIIVKPPQGESGLGIRCIDQIEELQQEVNDRAANQTLPLLVQEWFPGSDTDLSLIANRGEMIAYTVQSMSPEGMRFINHPQIEAIGRELCRQSNYHGVAHIDMRIDERTGEVKVIEWNPRFWGSLMYSTWMGVNFLDQGIAILQENIAGSPFQPVQGLCKSLWPTRSEMFGALKRGFQPPAEWQGCDRQKAWKYQIFDPMPEWFDFMTGHKFA